jgi:hypothetical protein
MIAYWLAAHGGRASMTLTASPPESLYSDPDLRHPVFIVGMNGSGTTMLLDSLCRHSALYGFPRETRLIPHLIRVSGQYEPLSDPANFVRLWKYVTGLAQFRLANGGVPQPLPPDWQTCSRNLAGLLNMLLLKFAQPTGKTRWCEKSPQYAHHMLALLRLFPGARFVHVIRDGRDCARSFHRRWQRSPELTITRWKQLLQHARAQRNALGTRYLEVRFEELTASPEVWMKRICEFLELPFEAAVLESSRPYLSSSRKTGSLQINSGQWRAHFSVRRVRRLESIAGRLLAEHGYATSLPEADLTPGIWRQRGWKAADALRQQLREIRLKLRGRIARPWWSILIRPLNAYRQDRENPR